MTTKPAAKKAAPRKPLAAVEQPKEPSEPGRPVAKKVEFNQAQYVVDKYKAENADLKMANMLLEARVVELEQFLQANADLFELEAPGAPAEGAFPGAATPDGNQPAAPASGG